MKKNYGMRTHYSEWPKGGTNWGHVERWVITDHGDDMWESAATVLQRLHSYLTVYFHYVNRKAS